MDSRSTGVEAIKRRVRREFGNITSVWPATDSWSAHTHREIGLRLQKWAESFSNPGASVGKILNVGSHGNTYSLNCLDHFHVDVAEASLRNVPLSVAADAEHLPFAPDQFDAVVCVGSVINYCRPPNVFAELSRVLKSHGMLILEFETSESFELLLTPDFGSDVALIKTFYNGKSDNIYVYSLRYIFGSLSAVRMHVIKVDRFHRLSALGYRISGREQLSAKLAKLDWIVEKLPILRNYSANIFLVAYKRQY